MRVAFPTQEDSGDDSPGYGHFGSARFFIVVDTESGRAYTKNNNDLNHVHGQCRATEGTVSENLKLLSDGKLPMFEKQHTCSGHNGNGACSLG